MLLANAPSFGQTGNMTRIDSLTAQLHRQSFLQNQTVANPDIKPGYPSPQEIQDMMNSLGSEIQLEYNSYVKGFIDLYGVRKNELTARMMGLGDYYFPIYEEVLDKNNLPLELKYLSVVESALNPKATSWAGATGPWQFIYSTGVMYGLTINSYVDERRDIYRSTQAACDYFRNSYEIYGDWLLVIASYNCGPGNVNKAIRKAGGVKNFWKIQQYLPKETRGYVPAFIAVTYLMNFPERHGITPIPFNQNPLVEAVEIDELITFEQLAAALEMNIEHLVDLNPHYKKDIVPNLGKTMSVYLPYEKAMKLAVHRDSISTMPLYDEEGKAYQLAITVDKVRYKVRNGDNLNSIARKYNVSPADIKEWNIIARNKVVPGRYLTIHQERKERVYLDLPEQPVMAKMVNEEGPCAEYHVIRSGDTLYSIAKQYPGISVEKLREWNNLNENQVLVPGLVLKVAQGS